MRDNDNAPDWDERNKNRTPMQWSSDFGAGFTTSNETWLPIHPNYVNINLQAQKNMERSTYKYLQSLTALRKKRAFREGKYDDKVISEHVFAYAR
jgi:alpha-glucosidase